MKLLIFVAVAISSACQRPAGLSAELRNEHQPALDRIADRCGMPRNSWTLLEDNKVTLNLSPDVQFEKADCLIQEFHKSGLPLQLGFIGNEAYEQNEQ